MTDRIQEKRLQGKVEDLDKENSRLRAEVSLLNGSLRQEREEHEKLVDLLKTKPTKVKVKKRVGILRLAAVGGAAYVFGAKAGRERYDRIRTWFDEMRGKAADAGEEAMSTMTNAASPTKPSSTGSTPPSTATGLS
ncbi:MAG TPA: hypothetical protein VH989_10600 [Actinomycetota bacterium]